MTNRAVHPLFGYTKTEMRGKNVSLLLPPVVAEQHTSYIRNYITTGDPVCNLPDLPPRHDAVQHSLLSFATCASREMTH
jgi:PAS domain S-box-containing protein